MVCEAQHARSMGHQYHRTSGYFMLGQRICRGGHGTKCRATLCTLFTGTSRVIGKVSYLGAQPRPRGMKVSNIQCCRANWARINGLIRMESIVDVRSAVAVDVVAERSSSAQEPRFRG